MREKVVLVRCNGGFGEGENEKFMGGARRLVYVACMGGAFGLLVMGCMLGNWGFIEVDGGSMVCSM